MSVCLCVCVSVCLCVCVSVSLCVCESVSGVCHFVVVFFTETYMSKLRQCGILYSPVWGSLSAMVSCYLVACVSLKISDKESSANPIVFDISNSNKIFPAVLEMRRHIWFYIMVNRGARADEGVFAQYWT